LQRVCFKAGKKKKPKNGIPSDSCYGTDSSARAENQPHLTLCETSLHPAHYSPARWEGAADLLYDVLGCAEAGRFDDGARLLWGDIMDLNKETVILRADGCIFLCFLKDVSLV